MESDDRSLRDSDQPFLFGILVIGLALMANTFTADWAQVATADNLGVSTFARVALTLLILGSVLSAIANRKEAAEVDTSFSVIASLAVIVIAGVFIFSAFRVGPVAMTVVMVPIFLYLTGVRSWQTMAVATSIATGIIVIGFRLVVNVWFPPNIWLL